jgi:hypothetical protein
MTLDGREKSSEMKPKPTGASIVLCLLLAFVPGALAPGTLLGADDVLKLQAVLVWGTNAKNSPDPNHKAVEPLILKKLQELPLKWTNYFEVNRKSFSVGANPSKVNLSDKCQVEVKNLGKSSVEVCLVGQGSTVLKRSQALPKGETLVLGGNAPNATAWLVVLLRNE